MTLSCVVIYIVSWDLVIPEVSILL